MEIIWTQLAHITFKEVFENLEWRWTKKEMGAFRDSTNNVLDKIKNGSITYLVVNKKLSIRKAKIHKNVSLFYKEDSENSRVFLITFFNNRMNPKTLKKLLS